MWNIFMSIFIWYVLEQFYLHSIMASYNTQTCVAIFGNQELFFMTCSVYYEVCIQFENTWLSRDITAAMVIFKDNRLSLGWELNSILMQILRNHFVLFCTQVFQPCHVSQNHLLRNKTTSKMKEMLRQYLDSFNVWIRSMASAEISRILHRHVAGRECGHFFVGNIKLAVKTLKSHEAIDCHRSWLVDTFFGQKCWGKPSKLWSREKSTCLSRLRGFKFHFHICWRENAIVTVTYFTSLK